MTQGEVAIVFGGAGFIGAHLLRRLARACPARLISVDIRPPTFPVPGVDYLTGDVRDLAAFSVDGEVATIFNLAAVHTTPGHADHEYYETNISGALEVCAFARRQKVRTIVFTSSISVYGPGEDTKSEASRRAPESAYGRSKAMAEDVHRVWQAEAAERRLVICRPAVIFGPGEGGNFTRLAGLLRRGLFVYPGRRDTIKACFYVEDLVDSLLHAAAREERVLLFNGCYPDRYTLETIVETFRAQHFPRARTLTMPRSLMLAAASALRPLAGAGIGIHPERVMKLVRSTDVVPGWLDANGLARRGQLPLALQRWKNDSAGAFN